MGLILNSNLFFGLAIVSALWGVVSSAVIASYLSQRGVKINFLFLRLFAVNNIRQYQKFTGDETGKSEPWFQSFTVSMKLALVTGLIGIILKALSIGP
jgi:hypothetical protein